MKILLISPRNNHPISLHNPTFVEDARGFNPPLGIMYIASYLLQNTNHTVDIFDGQLYDEIDLISQLMEKRYDVVGISVLTFTIMDALDVIKTVRRESPMSKIVVGGTHPTLYPNEMLALGADKVVRGEGEHIFPILLDNLDSDQKIFASREVENDLDKFPFPHRTNVEKYYSVFSKGKVTNMLTSRGCAFRCSFCLRPATGKRLRLRSYTNVLDEIEECRVRGINSFMFYDDTFVVDKQRIEKLCDGIIKEKMNIKFDARSRVDTIDENIISKLKKAGLVQMRLGIESGVQRVLDTMCKDITLRDTEKAFKVCKKYKVETTGYVMFGNKGETREDSAVTMEFIKKINPDFVYATIYSPFPGTPSYEDWIEKHGVDVWKEFSTNPTKDFCPPAWGDIPRKELEIMVREFYKKFYSRPSFIFKTILRTNPGNLKKYARAGINLFFKKGW